MPARIISIGGKSVKYDDGEYVEYTIMYQEENRRYNSARFVGSPEELEVVVQDIVKAGAAWQDVKTIGSLKHPFS